MKQVVQSYKTGQVEVLDVPPPTLRSGSVLVGNRFSLLSAGTERSALEFGRKSLIGKAQSRPDLVRDVINKVRTDGLLPTYRAAMTRLETPEPLGYSCAGFVLATGDAVPGIEAGDLVACGGTGYACHAEVVAVPKNLVARVPDGVPAQAAAFATLGAVAMQGVRRAALTPGERVAVIGLGLVGQLTVAILAAYGFPTLGLDIDPGQVERAKKLGLTGGGSAADGEALALAFTNGVGMDAVVVAAATESSEPVDLAGRISRERGRVSLIGAVGMDVPRRLYYEKELDLVVSRSYGPGRYDPSYEERGQDYPLPYVRWTEQRNMEEFLRLLGTGRLDVEPLIAQVVPIGRANEAYNLIMAKGSGRLGAVLLEYPPHESEAERPAAAALPTKSKPARSASVGLIGAGAFARSVLLPNLAKAKGASLIAVAASTGVSATHAARKFGARYATTDYYRVLDDRDVNLVIIATRHNLHARMAIEALERGKDVFVEKPLAMTVDELRNVAQAARAASGRLTVGFNRRYAPLVQALRAKLWGRTEPLLMTFRVNAGPLPAESWVRDPSEGGGRVLGEVCHFVDLLSYLSGSSPIRLTAMDLNGVSDPAHDDNLAVTLAFADGSTGTVVYSSSGAPSMAKERLEAFCDGRSYVIDNFRTLETYVGHRRSTVRRAQDKGHAALLSAACQATTGGEAPMPLDSLLATSLATLLIRPAIEQRTWVTVDPEKELGLPPAKA